MKKSLEKDPVLEVCYNPYAEKPDWIEVPIVKVQEYKGKKS